MSFACLTPIEDLIRDAQRAYDDTLWSAPDTPVERLSGLLNELDYLYSLKAQGVLWEPNF